MEPQVDNSDDLKVGMLVRWSAGDADLGIVIKVDVEFFGGGIQISWVNDGKLSHSCMRLDDDFYLRRIEIVK